MGDVNVTNITNERYQDIFRQLDTESEFKFYAGVPVVGSKKIRASGTALEMLRCVAIDPAVWVSSMSIGGTVRIGGIPENNTTDIDSIGMLSMQGTATVWEDIQGSLIGKKLFETKGTVDFDYEENALKFQTGGDISKSNDRVFWNYQYPHKAKPGGELRLHMHYEQTSADDNEFTVMYRIQDTGAVKNEVWTTVVVSTLANNIFPYISGTINQICPIVNIDMTDHGLSSQMQFRFARTDSLPGDILATFIDGHYEINTLGSNEEFVK